MSSRRSWLALVLLPWLAAGCGFTPVYQQGAAGNQLRSITIDVPPRNREAQQLRIALEDAIAPGGAPTNGTARYRLNATPALRVDPLSIDPDGTIRRYRIIGSVSYSLSDSESGEVLQQGTVERFNSYNISDADYSTYTAAEDARALLLESLAEEIRLRLIAALPASEGSGA